MAKSPATAEETKDEAPAKKGKARRVPNMGRIQVEVERWVNAMSVDLFKTKDEAAEHYQPKEEPGVATPLWTHVRDQPDHKDTAAAWAWAKEQKLTGRLRVVAVKAVHRVEEVQTVETKVTVES